MFKPGNIVKIIDIKCSFNCNFNMDIQIGKLFKVVSCDSKTGDVSCKTLNDLLLKLEYPHLAIVGDEHELMSSRFVLATPTEIANYRIKND